MKTDLSGRVQRHGLLLLATAAVLTAGLLGLARPAGVLAAAHTCPLSQGYWATHPGAWPVHSLVLGNATYSQSELQSLLNASTKGDASLILAVQLIAAKLNLAMGTNPVPIAATVADADRLLGAFAGKLPYKVTTPSPTGRAMVADATSLERYNLGLVTGSCANTPPVANAGPDQTVVVATVVQLDGHASTDADGDALTFRWRLVSAPGGSGATLSDPSALRPTFVVDRSGTYVVELVVNDGITDSAPDTVQISTENSRPVANAGADQTVATGDTVVLDGSASSDVDGDPLTFFWTLTQRPPGSHAQLTDPTAVGPAFIADAPGRYVAQLVVNDGTVDSAADSVQIDTVNSKPVADAGPDQDRHVGDLVQLDGGGSRDVDGDPLTYRWSFTVTPSGSAATFSDPTAVNPTFVPDLPGLYVVQLIANDGQLDSQPDTATVSVTVVVPPSNRDPVAADDAALIAQDSPGITLTVLGNDADPDGDPISINGVTQPAHGVVTNGSSTVTYTPSPGFHGIDPFTYTITDGRGGFATATVRITVDQPPQVSAGAAQSITLPATASLQGTVTDDGLPNPPATVTQAWSQVSGPGTVTFDDPSAVSTTAGFSQPGAYVLRLTASDGFLSASADVQVTVNGGGPGNHPPVITSSPVTTGDVGQPYRYTVTASDPDPGDTLTFSLTIAPAGMTIDPTTGAIAWTPTPSQSGPQAASVHVQDGGGLSATQYFVVQVARSSTNRAPVAADDAYEVRAGESLSVAAPGVLGNDTDPDGERLTATLVTRPTNGTLQFNPDGSFTYTPDTLREGELVLAENVNLATHLPGVTVRSSNTAGFGNECGAARCAIDDDLNTIWATYHLGASQPDPFLEVEFPQDVTVSQLRVIGIRVPTFTDPATKIQAGVFQLFAADGTVRFDSGAVALPLPDGDVTLAVPNVAGVRRVRFTDTLDGGGGFVGFAELRVIGSTLIRRERVVPDQDLVHLVPATARASSVLAFNVAENAIDENLGTNWYGTTTGDFFELLFPVDITVTEVQTVNPNGRPDGFGTSLTINCAGRFELFDASDTSLYDSGLVATPRGVPTSSEIFSLPVPSVAGVRSVRYTSVDCTGSSFPPGFSEVRVFGSAALATPTPAFNVKTKFSALAGRRAHSTPVVANLTDSNGDGRIDQRDIPNILVPVESVGNQLTGEIKVLSGNDGRELFTLGAPDLVSPWAEVAVGDLDGDGVPDVVAVHSDGNHLIAFDLAGGLVQGDLTRQLESLTLNASSTCCSNFDLGDGVDGNLSTMWFSGTNDKPSRGSNTFYEIGFPQDVTVTEIQLFGPRDSGSGAGTEFAILAGIFQLFAADGTVLFDSGVVNMLAPNFDLTLSVPNVAVVRRMRFTATADQNNGQGFVGLSELKVIGSALVSTGAPKLKWVSDPNPMPRFFIGSSALIGGAVSIANLDGGPRPHIVVGASVFDADGKLLGDGLTLGGTTGGTGLRSAMSAIADVDLDGTPEIIAGPTAYRLVNGQLTKVWQRTDRPDGYVAIANFDDDPRAEIVVVADGLIYMLKHDGTDAEVWNPPTHAPLPIPVNSAGGVGPAAGQAGPPLIVDVDGDGIPEIGIATSSAYILFNRDDSVRWQSGISDHSSHSTGAVAFDFDGDGEVEIVYRDEQFLRIFRGRDGVLLAKVPIVSSTWAEQPVVVDVDNDGHADIVVSSDTFLCCSKTGVYVLQDVANKWTRTRRIWNQHGYHITNVNEDGSIPRVETPNWLVPGLNNFRTNAFVPGESPDQADRFTYRASDGRLESNDATVRITVRTPNGAPRFTSTPVTTAAVGLRYLYGARATDPDAGDVLTFSLPTAPAGMTVDPNTGLVQWTPVAPQLGPHDVVVKVHDVRGAFALQSYTVQVANPVTVPNVVGQPQATAEATITSASFTAGAITLQPSATVTAGLVMSQSPAGGSLAAPGSPVSLVVASGPPPPGRIPNVVGQVRSNAQADILAAGFSVGTITNQNSLVVPLDVVISQSPAAGTIAGAGSPVSLVVSLGPAPGDLDRDGDGFTPNQGDCNDADPSIHPGAVDIAGDGTDQNCNGRDSVPGDTTPPTVAIAAPADLAVITMPTDITGTADDANFLRYTLQVARVDDEAFTVIGSGTSPVLNGVLGRLDPTLLENGLYRVRLLAEDANGQISVDERVYRVAGEAKVGVLALSFIDLRVPVAGIPITVVRAYDSRVKTQRDFGVGWSLQLRTGTYQNNRRPGDSWTVTTAPGPFGLPCTVITETRSHLTEVRLSDREFYVFRPRLTNLAALVGGCVGSVRFEFVEGSLPGATLEVLGNADIIYTSGDTLTEFDGSLDTGLVFDPRRVRLATPDGRTIDLERGAGITRIQDANANALTITAAGVVHSSGKSITFARDAQGRISRITDPNGNRLSYGYDGNGDLAEFVDQADNRTTFAYDARHNLLEIHDPLGNRAFQGEYDADGRLIAMVDAQGRRLQFSHDVAGREDDIIDARGNLTRVVYSDRGDVLVKEQTVTIEGTSTVARTTSQYDALGNQVVTVDPDGRRTEATYVGQSLTESVVDPLGLGLRTTATYNTGGAPLSQTDPTGNTTTFAYNAKGTPALIRDALGNATTIENDAQGNPTRIVDPLGTVTQLTHDDAGRLLREERFDATGVLLSRRDYTYDANGNRLTDSVFRATGGTLLGLTTTFAYDGKNRLVATTDPLGHTARIEYNAVGKESARIDALGRRTAFTYDEVGALIRTVFPDGTVETRDYDGVGNVIRRVDRAGRATAYEYDELKRLVRTILPDGSSERTVYSPGGLVTARIDAKGNRTDFAYDAAGRRIRTTAAEAFDAVSATLRRAETIQQWDAAGRLLAAVEANGNRTAYAYDAAGRRIRTTYADGTTREERYDALGRVTERHDEAGRVTRFDYDALGRLTSVLDPMGGRTAYRYDEAGNLVSQTDARWRTTQHVYDALNRLVEKILPGGAQETFAYDAVGNLTSHRDFNGNTVTYQYDAVNRLARRSFSDSSSVAFTYTATGKRATATDARGTTRYEYDVEDRLARVTHPGGDVLSYAYDANGQLQELSSPAATVNYEYDTRNRLSQTSTPSGATAYRYDVVGNAVEVAAPNGVLTRRSHDSRNRLTEILHTVGSTTLGSFTYQLSPTGRRLRVTEADDSAETYEYDGLDRLVGEVRTGADPRSLAYEYDAVGNRTRMVRDGSVTLYSYDADDRLLSAGTTSYSYDGNGDLMSQSSGGSTTTYAWDFEGRLVSAIGPSGATQFTYDADGNRVERRVDGTITRFLIDGRNPTRLPQVLEERDGGGSLRAHYLYGHDLLAMTRGAATSFYQSDGLGSTRLLTDEAGTVTDTYGYEGYGALAAATGSTANPYLFTGEQFEPATGLYNLRARNYDPAVGRFLGRDPEPGSPSDPRSRHPFVYAQADPVNRIDPTGRFSLIEISVSLASADNIAASFGKNLVTNFFLPAGRIALCQLKPAFQLRETGLLMIAADLPGGDQLFELSGALIQDGVRQIQLAGQDFARSLGVTAVKIEVGGRLAKLVQALTGADPSSLIDPSLTLDERAQKVMEFKNKLETWLEGYANAVESLQAGNDCTRWEGVTFFGEKALEVLPFFE